MEPTITSLVHMGLTHAEIAQRLGVSERHVRTLVRDAGLSADVPGRPVSRPACVDDPAWLAARTVAQAAADAGVSESTINRARARHRVKFTAAATVPASGCTAEQVGEAVESNNNTNEGE